VHTGHQRVLHLEASVQAHEHRDVVARVGDVTARVLAGAEGVDDAVALLDRAEADTGVPLVDESERNRLEELAAGRVDRHGHWHSVLARRNGDDPEGDAVGYAALLLPTSVEQPHLHDHDHGDHGHGHDERPLHGHASDDQAQPIPLGHGDVALDHGGGADGTVLRALLQACDVLGRRHDTRRLQVWMRHVTESDLRHATAAGYCVDRRLGVLARPLTDLPDVEVPDGVTIGAFTDADADAVVDVLAAAYAGTPDGGWTRARFDARRSYDWFDPADLLVARRDNGTVAGVHWTKRRGDGVGEVYNLAVHPHAQGERLGGVLLTAGLRHLANIGCDRVLLWVDLANEPAVRLYTSQGFEVAWEDVALGRELLPTSTA